MHNLRAENAFAANRRILMKSFSKCMSSEHTIRLLLTKQPGYLTIVRTNFTTDPQLVKDMEALRKDMKTIETKISGVHALVRKSWYLPHTGQYWQYQTGERTEGNVIIDGYPLLRGIN